MILITGVTGFVGGALCSALEGRFELRGALRAKKSWHGGSSIDLREQQLTPDEDWSAALQGVDTVIHCAARVHLLREQSTNPSADFHYVNVGGTLNLARQALHSGVRRFIFLSSIGVNGGETDLNPINDKSDACPHSPYAISKHRAELALFSLANKSAMEVVVIRPPLVYGPNAPGNFATLMNWLWSGFPLPFGMVTNNRRSFVCIDNLVSLIEICLDHPAAANQTFLVSDDEDLSTAALLRRLTTALGRPVRLIPVPVGLITLGAKMIGRPGIAQRLCGSLQVDIGKTKELLGWSPLVSVDEGLRRAAEHWLKSCGKRQRVSG
jgi:nucleoside-diphosphate-sugar epimerase|nr:SDR family oxidoreductase [Candidatus Accumulibacter sp. ACC012]